jgi:hypothetical protein
MPSMDPESSTSSAELGTIPPALNWARVLLWAKQHGPLAALALFVLYEGGALATATGVIC